MEIFRFNSLDSTNNKAKEILEETNQDFVVISEIQTKGKGRLNRKWSSPIGGAWFSIAIREVFNKPQLLSFCASLAVCDIVGKGAKVKWPNDVYILDKKLAGILLEMVEDNIIIGIGINVNNDIEEGLKGISLKNYKQADQVIDEIINSVIENFEKYRKEKNIISLWKKKCLNIGKKLSIKTIKGTVNGKFYDIDSDGFLLLDIGVNQSNIIKIIEGDIID